MSCAERINFTTLSPFIKGISKSIKIRSYRFSESNAIACLPFSAKSYGQAISDKYFERISLLLI